MERSRIAVLVGCLLVAGSAGAGTASAHQPGRAAEPPPAVDVSPEPLPDPLTGPRLVVPERRSGTIPHVVPRRPGPVPIPLVKPQRPGPVPMPQLDRGQDQLLPGQGLERPPRLLREVLPPQLDATTGSVR